MNILTLWFGAEETHEVIIRVWQDALGDLDMRLVIEYRWLEMDMAYIILVAGMK